MNSFAFAKQSRARGDVIRSSKRGQGATPGWAQNTEMVRLGTVSRAKPNHCNCCCCMAKGTEEKKKKSRLDRHTRTRYPHAARLGLAGWLATPNLLLNHREFSTRSISTPHEFVEKRTTTGPLG
jgi:hypothetical protein